MLLQSTPEAHSSVEAGSDNNDVYLDAAHYPADQFKHLHMVSGFQKEQKRHVQAFGGLG